MIVKNEKDVVYQVPGLSVMMVFVSMAAVVTFFFCTMWEFVDVFRKTKPV